MYVYKYIYIYLYIHTYIYVYKQETRELMLHPEPETLLVKGLGRKLSRCSEPWREWLELGLKPSGLGLKVKGLGLSFRPDPPT